MRVCSVAGCPTIFAATEGSRCPAHRKQADRDHWDRTKGYNTKGHRQRFRPGVLARDPICVLCQVRQSEVADHHPHSRRDLIALGLDPNDPQYGRGLCTPCHNSQTATNQPGGWNAR